MPTTRKRRAHSRRAPISETALAFLRDLPLPKDGNVFEQIGLRYNRAGCAAALWTELGDEVTATWIKAHPGTRPNTWWQFSAPRAPDQGHGRRNLIEARRHVGGGGKVDDGEGCTRYGVPRFCYQDRPPREPTLIEAQACYLDRHHLLAEEERRRIPATNFEPVHLEEADE